MARPDYGLWPFRLWRASPRSAHLETEHTARRNPVLWAAVCGDLVTPWRLSPTAKRPGRGANGSASGCVVAGDAVGATAKNRPDRVRTLLHHRQDNQCQSRPPRVPDAPRRRPTQRADHGRCRTSADRRVSHINRRSTRPGPRPREDFPYCSHAPPARAPSALPSAGTPALRASGPPRTPARRAHMKSARPRTKRFSRSSSSHARAACRHDMTPERPAWLEEGPRRTPGKYANDPWAKG